MVISTHAKETLRVLEMMCLLLACVMAVEPPKFGYTGPIGPEHWSSLSPNYSLCSSGAQQSPIDIIQNEAWYDSSMGNLKADYVSANATLINNGFNIELRFEQGVGNVMIDGRNYSLLQTHWHSPAEHTVDGKRYPVELHLVHKTQEGNVTVVAVFYEYGSADPFLNQLMNSLVKLECETRGGDEEATVQVGVVDTKDLAPDDSEYFRYVGSLTAPPCTEKVIWNILGQARQMTPQQAEALEAPLRAECRKNSRPLQALNGRKVELYHAAPSIECHHT